MVGVCHYVRTIHVGRDAVWKVLTTSQKWHTIPGLDDWFGHVEWIHGEPWRVGSRILIEHYWPSQRDVRLVLVEHHPPHDFAWIGHDRGLTAHQHVRLDELDEDSCRLTSTMSYASNAEIFAVPDADPMAERLLRTFLDAIADHAEGRVGKCRVG